MTVPVPPTPARAVQHDAAWLSAWMQTIRDTFAKFPNRVVGKTLEFGDSLTYTQAYGFWTLDINGHAGATQADLDTIHWAHFDIASAHNGFRNAWDGITAQSGMSWFDGMFDTALTGPNNFKILDAQFAVMMCNVPDAGNPTNVDIVEQRIDQYLAVGIVPILSTIPPRVADNPFDETIGKPYNAALYALARRKAIPLIDLAAVIYKTRPDDTWQTTLLSADGVHLSGGNDTGAGFNPGSDPYADNEAALTWSGYLLRTWITVQKMTQIRQLLQGPTGTRLHLTLRDAVAADPQHEPLLQAENLVYQGGFRLPDATGHGGPDGSGFAWAFRGFAFNPAHNSLFINGHSWYEYTAEISIPAPSLSPDQAQWPVASFMQDFAATYESHLHEIGAGGAVYASAVTVGGIFPYKDKLLGTALAVYDSNNETRRSFYTHSLTLNEPSFQGMFTVGPETAQAFLSGYMAAVPPQWQPLLNGPVFCGQSGASIIFRQSLGPAAIVFDPEQLGVADPVPATALIYYSVDHPGLGQYSGSTPPGSDFTEGVQIDGAAFPVGSRSVLFFGRQGVGTSCYGSGYNLPDSGTVTVEQNIELVYFPCYGVGNSHGNNSVPYKNWVWAYDANDLAKVAKGEMLPYDTRPYAVWPVELASTDTWSGMGGVGYDPATQLLYLLELTGATDGITPVVRVFKVNLTKPVTGDVTPPTTPLTLTATSPSSHEVLLTWTPSTDDSGTVAYKISRDGKPLSLEHGTTYRDYNLWASTTYTYGVQAVDPSGNLSGVTTASATTHAVPNAPGNLTATVVNGHTILTWDAAFDNYGILSKYYKIFRDNAPYNVLAVTTDTTYEDLLSPVGPSTYVVVALDSGLKFGGQAGISVTIP